MIGMDKVSAIGSSAVAGATSLTAGAIQKAKPNFTEFDLAFDALPFTFTVGDFFLTAGFLLSSFGAYLAFQYARERKRRKGD